MRKILIASLLALLLAGCGGFDRNKMSPFSGMRWQQDQLWIQHDGDWRHVIEIDGRPVQVVFDALGRRDPSWRQHASESFCQTMAMAEMPCGRRVEVVLEAGRGQRQVIALKPSRENRQANWLAAERYPGSSIPHPSNDPNRYRQITTQPYRNAARLGLALPNPPSQITAEQASHFLDKLEGLIEHRFSYRDRTGFAWQEAIASMRLTLRDGGTAEDLELMTQKLMAALGDGHAYWMTSPRKRNERSIPIRLADTTEGIVVLDSKTREPLDAEHVLLETIDGIPLRDWMDAAEPYATRGSPQNFRRRQVNMLRDIEVLRVERGLAATGPARLGLRSLDGKRQRVVEVPLITRASPNGDKPPSVALLDGNIGHLRIPKMIDSDADTVARWMDTLRNTSGLIIDVRGNPGGSRDLLRLLAPYFIDPNEAYVSSIARYRIGPLDVPDAQQGYLADRGMYPRSSDRFSETEQLALMRAERSFAPDWQPPNIDDFSPLHFLVHRKADNPLAYRYERPVVVLTDHESFSATDLFANAFKGRPGVTLIGRATGGGSGNANGYWFPFGTPRYGKDFVDSVGLLTLSSMVSYAANGRLIEGMGIEPDIVVPLGAMEATGRSDATLDAAISHLGGEPPPIAGMEVVKET